MKPVPPVVRPGARKTPSQDPKQFPLEWRPGYWRQDKHGSTWDRVKAALRRDWEQTKADFGIGAVVPPPPPEPLRGDDEDQTPPMGTTPDELPTPGRPPVLAPAAPPPPATRPAPWAEVEPAFRYGVAAREQYGSGLEVWDESVDNKLSSEWDERRTGKAYAEVRPYVRHGWNRRP